MNIIPVKPDLDYNPILNVDSYKFSHYNQMPEGTVYMQSYLESRGGEFNECTLFALQPFLHQYLSKRVTRVHVARAQAFALLHGEPFNYEGWMHIVENYDGMIPVRIRAIKEGTVVPVSNVLLTIECADPKCFWVVSWLETALSRLWYPSTIAIASRESKKILKRFLDESSDTAEQDIWFKLHDFGGRGVTCLEQARLGGAAHLLSFFGSDTVSGVEFANYYYDCEMAGFSIPASEHSTVSSWTRNGEFAMFQKYIKTYLTDRQVPAGVPKLAACVSDTYNIFDAVKFWCRPDIREILKASGGTLVIRPDSGEPVSTLVKIFQILESELGDEITRNKKRYKVLPPYLRVIQGDGIDRKSMTQILDCLVYDHEWSATNIAFGSGGGLLQRVDRDTQKFAFKCCVIKANNSFVPVYKDPITDKGKKSKSGRLDLIKDQSTGQYITVQVPDSDDVHSASELVTVFDCGKILFHTTFAECRDRMVL